MGPSALKALTFEPADRLRFPGLFLAYDALSGPEGSSAVLNAAKEEAVAAFLDGTIRFPQIHSVNARTVEQLASRIGRITALEDLMALDQRARAQARAEIGALAR